MTSLDLITAPTLSLFFSFISLAFWGVITVVASISGRFSIGRHILEPTCLGSVEVKLVPGSGKKGNQVRRSLIEVESGKIAATTFHRSWIVSPLKSTNLVGHKPQNRNCAVGI